jgi:hypothetical protein
MRGVPGLGVMLLCAALLFGLLALGLNWSSFQAAQHRPVESYSLWVPGPTADPPSDQATACTGTQAEEADEVILDQRLPDFTTAATALDAGDMDRLRDEIITAALPRCAHRAQRYMLEWMRGALVQVQAEVGHADAAYITAGKQNADSWYKVMTQELAALVQRDFRNSGKQ